ncbi:amidase [Cryptosporangium aurantiacum]|uniref:Aspartyl-tRNA(Asn)/glutamyl-tRNA(Gln) amidotransferase subunit A n=1 Tax=Cryptosporangium aurantiacum TaxID=134849 RepID=A0A1M7RJH8_9ACTN|nr:amidase [Cryptosporangium aurantiacum]SHN46322.1 aspartyl-tRNA(Asn)/glutamyl-tRNA(Gln) amidotransferase subunit A [Cryptosporangium aurantiacum]
MTDDVHYWSARRVRAAFAAGELTPPAYLDALYDRVDAVGGRVNAVTELLADTARAAAAESAERWRSGDVRPLEGLPVAIKEEHPIAGRSLSLGSVAMPEQFPDRSHPLVERIVAAGGIPHLRTTTPEFCAAVYTHSQRWGVTVSPWNRRYTSGGSSGGSGAALAAGMAPLATGSDIGGSLRIPGAFCGVVGYKPPYGAVPALAPASLDAYCHDGVMARSPQDALLLHRVVAGAHPDDHVSLTVPPTDVPPRDRRRVAVSATLGRNRVAPDVRTAVDAAAETLSGLGYQIVDAGIDWDLAELARIAIGHLGLMMTPMMRAALGDRYADADRYSRYLVEQAEEALAEYGPLGVTTAEASVQADLAALFGEVDALVCPTALVAGLEAGNDYLPGDVTLDGVPVGVRHSVELVATFPFNMASRCPVLAVPSTVTSLGIPGSVQVVAAPYAESMAFAVAEDVHAAARWYEAPELRPTLE